MDSIKVSPRDVAAIIRATFPGYKGRKVAIRPVESVWFHDVNWSGGSRNQYRACTLDGRPTEKQPDTGARAPWDNPYDGLRVPTAQGFCIVEHCMFCGKDLGLRIYVHPSDMPKLLPQ